jgi:hypothetical protein
MWVSERSSDILLHLGNCVYSKTWVLCSLNVHFSSFCAHIYWSQQNFHMNFINSVGYTHMLSAKFPSCMFKLSLNKHVAEFIVGYNFLSHVWASYVPAVLCLPRRVELYTQKQMSGHVHKLGTWPSVLDTDVYVLQLSSVLISLQTALVKLTNNQQPVTD